MRVLTGGIRLGSCVLFTLISLSGVSMVQDPPVGHVVLPNPTPRDPDLKQVFGDTPADQERQRVISLQNQLRAREIWLESNQILLLAQQLQQEILSAKKSASMEANAAKARQIEKLAKSVQQQMRAR
jgi:hypothetical protein